MILTLDHTQRLQLVSMLDNIEGQGRRGIWAICALQNRLDLNDKEKEIIQYRKMTTPDGREYSAWNNPPNGNGIRPLEFEFSEDDTKLICTAVDRYFVVLARDRGWWEPLVKQLPEEKEAQNVSGN